jgi:hypothetical protein
VGRGKRIALLAILGILALGGMNATLAQDDEDVYEIDWCDIVNGRRFAIILAENYLNTNYDMLLQGLNDGSVEDSIGAEGVRLLREFLEAANVGEDIEIAPLVPPVERFVQPGWYDLTVPEIEGVENLADLLALTRDELMDRELRQQTIHIHIVDRGVDCVTGDHYGVVRLWDDKFTMVIFRDVNYDVTFFWPDANPIGRTPWMNMVGPFEPGQQLDEHELLSGTLRLYYLHDNVFQANWYDPAGGLVLEIPFTYPDPCPSVAESEDPGVPRICDGWNPQ